ncbi:hypothetical protein PVNG_05038 [Plasmodium vivax North Korean]|uniref:Uncharacterized protein n=1 Tax=Plasmodium vivax North Korean TaxID=1035514 RepID=A0A0J9U300_PLAVI|nr:hypothetical protein PVNG_05038 [Plasmodium vivax North Korean]
MAEVFFEVSKRKEKLDKDGCVVLFFDIEEEIKKKIGELEITQGENHIHNKCQEIDKYLQEQKNSHNECYQGSFKRYVRDIEKEANALLSESSVYSQYCKSLTSKDEELTKLKGKTVELGKEKGKLASEKLPAEKSRQTISSCNGQTCKDESSENTAFPVAHQTDDPEHSTGSAQITSRPSEGTIVIIDSPSAGPTVSELKKERSDTCKEKGCPSEDLPSSGHSTTEGSEARPSIPYSETDSVNRYNSTFISQEYIAGLKTIHSKIHNRENTQCDATKDQYTTDGSDDPVIIKLHDCKNENIAYTILENRNNETHRTLDNSQNKFQRDVPLSQSPGGRQTIYEKSTFPETQKILEQIQTKEELGPVQPQLLDNGKLNIGESSDLQITADHQVTVEPSGNVVPQVLYGSKSPFKSRRICDNANCGEPHLYINEYGSAHPNGEYQKNNAFTMEGLGEALNSGNGIVSSGDLMSEATDTVQEEPSLKNYITIIAMILGGILFCALLSKVKINLLY